MPFNRRVWLGGFYYIANKYYNLLTTTTVVNINARQKNCICNLQFKKLIFILIFTILYTAFQSDFHKPHNDCRLLCRPYWKCQYVNGVCMRVVIKAVALMLEQCRKYARKTRKKKRKRWRRWEERRRKKNTELNSQSVSNWANMVWHAKFAHSQNPMARASYFYFATDSFSSLVFFIIIIAIAIFHPFSRFPPRFTRYECLHKSFARLDFAMKTNEIICWTVCCMYVCARLCIYVYIWISMPLLCD